MILNDVVRKNKRTRFLNRTNKIIYFRAYRTINELNYFHRLSPIAVLLNRKVVNEIDIILKLM